MNDSSEAVPPRITGWDRAAISLLGAAGCALSYDALQQMAVAIHVRGILTYLFPLVIDGFIAYGVRALVVLRDAPFVSRAYVWLLFGGATAASIWANALHAVRLNGGRPVRVSGLRLGDLTVGVLSTLAPLALAGAVHLYILIARRTGQVRGRGEDGEMSAGSPGPMDAAVERSGHRGLGQPLGPERGLSGSPRELVLTEVSVGGGEEELGVLRTGSPEAVGRGSEGEGFPDGALFEGNPVSDVGDVSAEQGPRTPRRARQPTEQLLTIAQQAVRDSGRTSRAVVANAVRGQGISLSNDRLTKLMQALREQADTPDTFRAR